MPLSFPSHQGLIAPLWRRWQDSFGVLGLCVGALMPDVVDGLASPALRGHMGHWIGHSLLGVFAACLPAGMALTCLVRRSARRISVARKGRRPRAGFLRIGEWICSIDNASGLRQSTGRYLRLEAFSVMVGALSHLFFDMISHDHTEFFWPWAADPHWFGAWWYTTWFRFSAPGYRDYPVGPAFVCWNLLTVLGAWMFFRWPPRPASEQSRRQ